MYKSLFYWSHIFLSRYTFLLVYFILLMFSLTVSHNCHSQKNKLCVLMSMEFSRAASSPSRHSRMCVGGKFPRSDSKALCRGNQITLFTLMDELSWNSTVFEWQFDRCWHFHQQKVPLLKHAARQVQSLAGGWTSFLLHSFRSDLGASCELKVNI